MKIVTWNINSIRLRLPLLKKIIDQHGPDVIALQETKVMDSLFPLSAVRDLGYEYIAYSGQKSYNGVAILSKIPFVDNLALKLHNEDSRHIAIKINDIELHNFYVPAGGDVADINLNIKFKHKLEYIKLMQKFLTENYSKNHKIVLVGDLNIAPHEHDVWSSKQLRNVVSHTDIERSMLIELQKSLDFIDSARYFTDYNEKFYTWWSYRNIDWKKSNRGRRLDHIWVSNNLKNNLHSLQLISEARDWLQPSDHVPYCVNISLG